MSTFFAFTALVLLALEAPIAALVFGVLTVYLLAHGA